MYLKLFNTETRTFEVLKSYRGKSFGIYCCGPTVYGPAHVGNFRTYVVQDIVLRLLKLLGFDTCYVRNLTDVDDKTIRGAAEQHQLLKNYTQHWIDVFEGDCNRLNLLKPNIEPRATETIIAQQELIQILIDKGHAYSRGGSVYFRIASFKDYGRLSHLEARSLQTQSQNSAGKSNDADEYDREQIGDFVLWKAHKPEDGNVFWESPWGKGRPGWHIECSAMSHLYLGQTVDLHSGGVDLCFPHHENEIAQSEAAYGGPFVRHWLHIAHLKVNGQKMSKSLGNLHTLESLRANHYEADAVRYALSAGHYRQALNFTFELLNAAQSALQKIRNYSEQLLASANINLNSFQSIYDTITLPEKCTFLGDFFESLCDDLNVPKALGCLFTFINQFKPEDLEPKEQLLNEWAACLFALGITLTEKKTLEIPEKIRQLSEKRWLAKKERNFQEADHLRKTLEESGWKILDQKDSYQILPLD